MKKDLKVAGVVLILLIIGIFASYKIMNNAAEYEKNKASEVTAEPSETSKPSESKKTTTPAKQKQTSQQDQTAKIGGVQYDIGIDEESKESLVVEVMHKMTHQKVKASEKWGAIPLTEDTINQVYTIVSKSSFVHKIQLLEILDKWKKGDFDQIDHDHNYFWELEDGTIGKAYGVLSKEEEEKFIKNNFE
ncbi:DUF6241 domain-containing protein [Neobacillus cucumis]|uniref:CTP synthase n=1 Tax=Neobacillus cucumis TaxID=1740721 RepID=A0A2N5HR51_9BACI|nr:DUF6241 domain-containing protein [Neobacillus cucumis]PLS08005.1 hypothetical protein CVD27_04830 [Neobacillus cucumis]